MRETLDRIQEAQTAVDRLAIEARQGSLSYTPSRQVLYLWTAKYLLWEAAWRVIESKYHNTPEAVPPTPNEEVNP